jgi:hypothetical protein
MIEEDWEVGGRSRRLEKETGGKVISSSVRYLRIRINTVWYNKKYFEQRR